jgi:hypothetical protein
MSGNPSYPRNLEEYRRMMKSSEYLTVPECKRGYLYEIFSRNLRLAVYDGEGGFIGIREKFGALFLSTERHWDEGEPFGTVKPLREIGIVPTDIEVTEYLGSTGDNPPASIAGYQENRKLFDWLSEQERRVSLYPDGRTI